MQTNKKKHKQENSMYGIRYVTYNVTHFNHLSINATLQAELTYAHT